MLTLKEKIERQQELKERINDLLQQLSSPEILSVDRLAMELGDMRMRLESHISRYGAEGTLSTREAAVRRELKSAVEGLSADVQKKREHAEQVRNEYELLKAEFESGELSCSTEDLASVQAELQGAQSQVDKLNLAIQERQNDILEMKSQPSELKPFMCRRQNILACQETGEEYEDNLEEVEQEIQRVKAEMAELQESIDRAEQVVAGLQNRRVEAEAYLITCKRDLAEAIPYYLSGQALLIEADYASLASKLQQKYFKLLALGNLIEKHSSESFPGRIACGMSHKFFIPKFTLPASCEGMESDLSYESGRLNPAIAQETKTLEQLGIN